MFLLSYRQGSSLSSGRCIPEGEVGNKECSDCPSGSDCFSEPLNKKLICQHGMVTGDVFWIPAEAVHYFLVQWVLSPPLSSPWLSRAEWSLKNSLEEGCRNPGFVGDIRRGLESSKHQSKIWWYFWLWRTLFMGETSENHLFCLKGYDEVSSPGATMMVLCPVKSLFDSTHQDKWVFFNIPSHAMLGHKFSSELDIITLKIFSPETETISAERK